MGTGLKKEKGNLLVVSPLKSLILCYFRLSNNSIFGSHVGKMFSLCDSMNEFSLQWLRSGLLPLAHAAIAAPESPDAICAALRWSSRANVMSQNPSDSSGKCSLIDSSHSQLPIKCYDAVFHQGSRADLLVVRSPSSKLQQNCENQEKNWQNWLKNKSSAHIHTK